MEVYPPAERLLRNLGFVPVKGEHPACVVGQVQKRLGRRFALAGRIEPVERVGFAARREIGQLLDQSRRQRLEAVAPVLCPAGGQHKPAPFGVQVRPLQAP
ncbi:MAG: hypothetical protein ABIF82_11740 [Planctomycetota bacterium]